MHFFEAMAGHYTLLAIPFFFTCASQVASSPLSSATAALAAPATSASTAPLPPQKPQRLNCSRGLAWLPGLPRQSPSWHIA